MSDNLNSSQSGEAENHAPPGGDVRHSETFCDFADEAELSDVQLRAIELTVQGLSDVKVALMLSIERRTLWRWRTKDPNYRRVLEEARRQISTAATDQYQNLLHRATVELANFLRDESDDRRFRAATAILNMAGCFKAPAQKTNPSSGSVETNVDPQTDWPQPELPEKVG